MRAVRRWSVAGCSSGLGAAGGVPECTGEALQDLCLALGVVPLDSAVLGDALDLLEQGLLGLVVLGHGGFLSWWCSPVWASVETVGPTTDISGGGCDPSGCLDRLGSAQPGLASDYSRDDVGHDVTRHRSECARCAPDECALVGVLGSFLCLAKSLDQAIDGFGAGPDSHRAAAALAQPRAEWVVAAKSAGPPDLDVASLFESLQCCYQVVRIQDHLGAHGRGPVVHVRVVVRDRAKDVEVSGVPGVSVAIGHGSSVAAGVSL